MNGTEKVAGLKTALETIRGIAEKVAADEVLYQRHEQPELADKAHCEWLGLWDAIDGIKGAIARLEGAVSVRDAFTARGEEPSDRSAFNYSISVSKVTGQYACSCADFMFRRAENGGWCKHIDRFLAEIGPNPQPAISRCA